MVREQFAPSRSRISQHTAKEGAAMKIRFASSCGFAAALSLLTLPALAEDGWKPYLEGKKGEVKEMGSPKEMKDKEWLTIHYTEFEGYKPRLGVVASEEKTAYPPEYRNEFARMMVDLSGKGPQATLPQNHIEDLVRQALMGTNRFKMVERTTATADILDEQDLGASGRVDQKTAAKIGKIKGTEYTVKATIIEINPEKDAKSIKAVGGAMGSSGLGMAGLGLSGKVAFCRLNVRVIRTETSEIVADQTVDGTAKSSMFDLAGGGLGATGGGTGVAGGAVGVKSKKEAPISDAMQACANKVAYFVANKLEDSPWQGNVASVTGTKVVIIGGTNVGLKEGMTLTLLAKGEDVVDPETNEVIGTESSEIGQIRIVTAQEKFSTCEITQGGEGAKKGDFVRRESAKQ
jgi:curli biogenesis system outer membrane secretion channel CsgG